MPLEPSPIASKTNISAPIAKVAYSAYVEAVVAIAIWVLQTYFHTNIPPEIAVAVSLLLSGLVGYFTPLFPHEVVR
jgi:hypothetical protein